jgi:EpsI family protein
MRKAGMTGSLVKGLFLPACLLLVVQGGLSRVVSITEKDIPIPGLSQLPSEAGAWKAGPEQRLERGVAEYLRPDDYILRDYRNASAGSTINLFVAYFKSLQNTWGPHSPSVCLPGAGWLVRSSKIETIQLPGGAERIPVNEYSLEKSGEHIFVVYWYQNERNVWAEEIQAKMRLLPDLIRYRRSDVSLVRLVTPTVDSVGDTGLANCVEFMRWMFPKLTERFQAAR